MEVSKSAGLILLSITLLASACTSTRVTAMVPKSFRIERHHPFSVRVGHEGDRVRGASSLDPGAATYFGSSSQTQADSKKFMEVLVAGITKSELFRDVTTKGDSDFRLDVNIVSEIKPSPGAQMKSTLVTRWKLTRTRDGAVVLDDLIETVGKAAPGSVVGIRTAIEAAVRQSVEEGVARLSRVQLD